MNGPKIFGVGECACGVGPGEFVLLGMRDEPFRTLHYCPSCGSTWESLEAVETENPRPIERVAPGGVRYPTEEEIRRHGAVDISQSGWGLVIAALVARGSGGRPS